MDVEMNADLFSHAAISYKPFFRVTMLDVSLHSEDQTMPTRRRNAKRNWTHMFDLYTYF